MITLVALENSISFAYYRKDKEPLTFDDKTNSIHALTTTRLDLCNIIFFNQQVYNGYNNIIYLKSNIQCI